MFIPFISIHKHPELYHKPLAKHQYFEGWYYKQVSADLKHTISFIPGIHYAHNQVHSFIQCIYLDDTNRLSTYYFDFSGHEFSTTNHPFSVTIEKNTFRYTDINLDIHDQGISIQGRLQFDGITTINTSLLCPNIMGPFSFIPYMECNHGVLSMSHTISGSLLINGKSIDFSGGKGYLEKDWGRSFPKEYIWLQSNHFEQENVSFFCAIAKIPVLRWSFQGLIANLRLDDEEYRFATYNGSKVYIKSFTDTSIKLILKNRQHTLYIYGRCASSKTLIAPSLGSMNKLIKEGINGKLRLVLKDNSGNVIYTSVGINSGMELVPTLKPRTNPNSNLKKESLL